MEIGLSVYIFGRKSMYLGSFMCSMQCHSNYLGQAPPSGKSREFKSMRYHYWYKHLSWCAVTDGNMTQRSLCLSLITMARVRIQLAFYFFLIFLELEFYFFRNYKRMQYFAYFFIIRIVLIWVRKFALQSTITYANVLIEN